MKRIAALTIVVMILIAAGAHGESASVVTAESMQPVLEKAKNRLVLWFQALDEDLSTAARQLSSLDFQSDEAQDVLKMLCISRSYVIDFAIIDPNGRITAVQPPEYRNYVGSDVSAQPHFTKLIKTKQPVLSLAFKSVEGTFSIVFQYPIISDEGEFRGSLSMLADQVDLLGAIINPIIRDVPSRVMILETDGVLIHATDPKDSNKNIFTDELYRPFPDLIDFMKKAIAKTSGTGEYAFYEQADPTGKIVKKVAVWGTVAFYGNEWRVIVREEEA